MIRPVILAGGSGFRLWPLSRQTCPKQYISLLNNGLSLVQQTVQRLKTIKDLEPPIILCNQAHYSLCQEQMHAMGIEKAIYILEPVGRNTAPAIAVAARYCDEILKKETQLLILPVDHVINDEAGFAQAIAQARVLVEADRIVIFGITPTEPSTGYGYIHAGQGDEIQGFSEKPTREQAKMWINQGGYYWNSGIFFAKSNVFEKEIKQYAPQINNFTADIFHKSTIKNNTVSLDSTTFSQCPNISFDYAVMEKTKCASMVPMNIAWKDLGSWDAITKLTDTDGDGNVLQGAVIAKETERCFIKSEDKWIITYGVKDLIIVSAHESILVMDKKRSESIKDIVDEINEIEQKIPALHAEIIRPWGIYESVLKGKDYHVKQLTVNPGAKISLQLHQYRSETWVVVAGKAKATVGNQEMELNVNQSVHIQMGEQHRVENIGTVPLIIVETQIGEYLGEEDIVRLQDDYGRVEDEAK